MSSHYALLFNRRKGKLSSEQKSTYDGKLKQVQQIFSLDIELDGSGAESDKGKKKETGDDGNSDEMKSLHDSSVSKAADMAAGYFTLFNFYFYVFSFFFSFFIKIFRISLVVLLSCMAVLGLLLLFGL